MRLDLNDNHERDLECGCDVDLDLDFDLHSGWCENWQAILNQESCTLNEEICLPNN